MTRRLGRRDRSSRDARDRRVAFVRAVGDIDPRLEIEALLQRVADVALAVGARSAVVAIRNDGAWRVVQAGHEIEGADLVAEQIASSGEHARVEMATEGSGKRVLFGVPLRGRRGVLGALWVETDESLPAEDEALVASLAELVAAAVTDATLFASVAETEEQSRRHDRAEAEFASMVSHELRNPIAAIRGFGRLLLERDEAISPEEQREFLEAVVRQADHMATLVDDILDVAQIEAGAFRCTIAPYDAGRMLAEAVKEASAAFPSHPITLEAPGDLPEAEGDAERLKQVLMNILSNACRYSADGSGVTVAAEATDGTLSIAVRDRGPGISEEDRDIVFARFGRLANQKSRTKGAGLGLYIARQIVEMHGGRIWVTGAPAGGSTFTFAVPFHPAA